MRHSLNDLNVACCRENCIYRGTMGEFATHRCPTTPESVNDLDTLISIAEDDERVPVRIACFRMVVEILLRNMDVTRDEDVLEEMYDLMRSMRGITEVQRIGLDALVLLCTAEEWRSVVNAVCIDLNDHLKRLSDDDSLRTRITSLRSLMPELNVIGALRCIVSNEDKSVTQPILDMFNAIE